MEYSIIVVNLLNILQQIKIKILNNQEYIVKFSLVLYLFQRPANNDK